MIVAPGLRLPDVFHPEWPAHATAHAERCASLADCRDLIGWVTDDPLDWASPSPAGRPSLLQLCLSLEPGYAAYHAAWEFVLALHGGLMDRVAQAWNTRLPNKEVVREFTRAEEGLGTRGYLRDEVRWTREFARRYFSTTAAAIRQADPNHLVFGCRFHREAGAAVLAECVYPAVDVSMPHWNELPAATANPLHPLVADDVSWVTDEFLRASAGRRTRRLTTVEHMLRKARAALDRMARHPAVVGYAWARWQDEPGEQAPFAGGLVHVNGSEAREHTELLTQFNLRAGSLRHSVRSA
jgi:agarase